jgi:hypothetical protein
MTWFMVSYDLRKEMSSDDYTKLYERLKSFSDWAWVLESVWIVRSTSSSAVYNHIAPVLDRNDGLIVAELSGSLCFDKPRGGISNEQWLSARFTCV